jgi:hypothetical protein
MKKFICYDISAIKDREVYDKLKKHIEKPKKINIFLRLIVFGLTAFLLIEILSMLIFSLFAISNFSDHLNSFLTAITIKIKNIVSPLLGYSLTEKVVDALAGFIFYTIQAIPIGLVTLFFILLFALVLNFIRSITGTKINIATELYLVNNATEARLAHRAKNIHQRINNSLAYFFSRAWDKSMALIPGIFSVGSHERAFYSDGAIVAITKYGSIVLVKEPILSVAHKAGDPTSPFEVTLQNLETESLSILLAKQLSFSETGVKKLKTTEIIAIIDKKDKNDIIKKCHELNIFVTEENSKRI